MLAFWRTTTTFRRAGSLLFRRKRKSPGKSPPTAASEKETITLAARTVRRLRPQTNSASRTQRRRRKTVRGSTERRRIICRLPHHRLRRSFSSRRFPFQNMIRRVCPPPAPVSLRRSFQRRPRNNNLLGPASPKMKHRVQCQRWSGESRTLRTHKRKNLTNRSQQRRFPKSPANTRRGRTSERRKSLSSLSRACLICSWIATC